MASRSFWRSASSFSATAEVLLLDVPLGRVDAPHLVHARLVLLDAELRVEYLVLDFLVVEHRDDVALLDRVCSVLSISFTTPSMRGAATVWR